MYGAALVALQVAGLVGSLWFLVAHRPRQWRRIQALDAMGFPAIVVLVFARGLALTLWHWPVVARDLGSMIFSLVTLALVDVWMFVKLASFRRFVATERRDYDDRRQSTSSD